MLRAGEPTLAVICVALFGLVVSPVSWSHHWVWMLPAVLVIGLLGWRRRNVALAMLSLAGVVLMRWTPIDLLPQHRETTAVWWRQLAGMSLRVVGAGGHRRCRTHRYRQDDAAALAYARTDPGADGQLTSQRLSRDSCGVR